MDKGSTYDAALPPQYGAGPALGTSNGLLGYASQSNLNALPADRIYPPDYPSEPLGGPRYGDLGMASTGATWQDASTKPPLPRGVEDARLPPAADVGQGRYCNGAQPGRSPGVAEPIGAMTMPSQPSCPAGPLPPDEQAFNFPAAGSFVAEPYTAMGEPTFPDHAAQYTEPPAYPARRAPSPMPDHYASMYSPETDGMPGYSQYGGPAPSMGPGGMNGMPQYGGHERLDPRHDHRADYAGLEPRPDPYGYGHPRDHPGPRSNAMRAAAAERALAGYGGYNAPNGYGGYGSMMRDVSPMHGSYRDLSPQPYGGACSSSMPPYAFPTAGSFVADPSLYAPGTMSQLPSAGPGDFGMNAYGAQYMPASSSFAPPPCGQYGGLPGLGGPGGPLGGGGLGGPGSLGGPGLGGPAGFGGPHSLGRPSGLGGPSGPGLGLNNPFGGASSFTPPAGSFLASLDSHIPMSSGPSPGLGGLNSGLNGLGGSTAGTTSVNLDKGQAGSEAATAPFAARNGRSSTPQRGGPSDDGPVSDRRPGPPKGAPPRPRDVSRSKKKTGRAGCC